MGDFYQHLPQPRMALRVLPDAYICWHSSALLFLPEADNETIFLLDKVWLSPVVL